MPLDGLQIERLRVIRDGLRAYIAAIEAGDSMQADALKSALLEAGMPESMFETHD